MRSSFMLAALGSALAVCLVPRIAAAQTDPSPAEASPPAAPTPSVPSEPAPAATSSSTAPQAAVPQEQPEKKDEDHSVYISFSPIHLLLPMVEVTGEARLHRNFGLAGIVGFGSVKPEGSSTRFTTYEL